jgi:hypothetical protein
MMSADGLFSGTEITGGLFVDAHPNSPGQDGSVRLYGFRDEMTPPL